MSKAAKLLDVSTKTLSRKIARGQIKAIKDGARWFIPMDEIEKRVNFHQK